MVFFSFLPWQFSQNTPGESIANKNFFSIFTGKSHGASPVAKNSVNANVSAQSTTSLTQWPPLSSAMGFLK